VADPSENHPVDCRKWRSAWITPPQHYDLLSQHQDFGFQRCARPEQIDDNSEDYPAEIQHSAEDHPILRLKPTRSNLRQGQHNPAALSITQNVAIAVRRVDLATDDFSSPNI